MARRELGPEEDFEEFTKYHSTEIGENALTGALGAHVLKHFDVIFDLPQNKVTLAPAGQLAEYQPAEGDSELLTPISLQNDLVWLPVTLPGPKAVDSDNEKEKDKALTRALAIGSSRYDTCLERRLCNSLRRPAGNVGPLRCATVDFAPYVAFRPTEVVQVHPDGVAGVVLRLAHRQPLEDLLLLGEARDRAVRLSGERACRLLARLVQHARLLARMIGRVEGVF